MNDFDYQENIRRFCHTLNWFRIDISKMSSDEIILTAIKLNTSVQRHEVNPGTVEQMILHLRYLHGSIESRIKNRQREYIPEDEHYV